MEFYTNRNSKGMQISLQILLLANYRTAYWNSATFTSLYIV